MARIKAAHQETTDEAVTILNGSAIATSTNASSKRKRSGEALRRPVGRPPKRSKTSTGAANTVTTTAAMTIGGEGEPDGRTSHPIVIAATAQGRSARTRGNDKNIYAFPQSPQAARKSRPSRLNQNGGNFSLQDGAFEALPPGTSPENGAGAMNDSPSRATRSKVNLVSDAQKLPRALPNRLVRQQRKLRSHPIHDDNAEEERVEASDQTTRATRTASLELGGHGAPGEENGMENPNIGYPSPERRPAARKRRAEKFDNERLTAPNRNRAAERNTGKPSMSTVADQTLAGGEIDNDPVTGSEYTETTGDDGVDDDENIMVSRALTGEDVEEEEGEGGEEEVEEQEDEGENAQEEIEEQEIVDDRNGNNIDHQQSTRPKFSSRFEAAANLHDCRQYWSTARSAARAIRERGDPSTRQVQKLCALISASKDELRDSVNNSSAQRDILDEFQETTLQRVATAIGNLKRDDAEPGRQAKRLARDIYVHAIPGAVELLCCILIVRSVAGTLDRPGIEELMMILKATCSLCERISKWKPKPILPDKIKSRTNNEIKLSLKPIMEEYEMALSDLDAAETAERAAIQAEEHAERMARQYNAHLQDIEEKRRIIAIAVAKRRQIDGARRQQIFRSTQPVRERTVIVTGMEEEKDRVRASDEEVCGADDVYESNGIDEDAEMFVSDDRFVREATEDIPGPTKRSWQKEETIALLLLLQRHRGPDRYELIHKVIQEISRDIRKLGADKFLKMADQGNWSIDLGSVADTLDDLGVMDVIDIEQQAQYLKAAQSLQMERDIKMAGNREAWQWLSSV